MNAFTYGIGRMSRSISVLTFQNNFVDKIYSWFLEHIANHCLIFGRGSEVIIISIGGTASHWLRYFA